MKSKYVLSDFKDTEKAKLIDRFTEDGGLYSYVQSTKLRDAINSLLGTRFKRVYVREESRKQLESQVVRSGKEVFFKGGGFEWDGEDLYCWTSERLILMSNSEWASFCRLY